MPAPLAAQSPLSAIDWLSRTIAEPPAPAPPAEGGGSAPGPTAAKAAPGARLPDPITVTPLDGPMVDAIGLLPASRAGLPRDLWGAAPTAELARRLSALTPDTLPALQQLTLALLVVELDPPLDAEGRGALFLTRLDRLVAFGALDQALALVEAAGPADSPELFARWLDLALLGGDPEGPCAALRARPDLAEGHPLGPGAGIFCLARGGDWEAAEAALAAPAAAALPAAERAALARFLDPDTDAAGGPAGADAPRSALSPLLWHLLDALGEAPPTGGLPLVFAHADLGPSAGWKARIEAAERLTRAGAMTPNRLLGLYTERAPAASGGVWDRVRSIQRLEAALVASEAEGVGDLLPGAWARMVEAELEHAFADLYAERLLRLGLRDEAAGLAFRIGLLADPAAAVAARHDQPVGRDAFLAAIAAGALPPEGPRPSGAMAEAIALGLTAPPSAEILARIEEAGRGMGLIEALARLQAGGAEDPRVVAETLPLLRAAGQEEVARRTALQILLLDRRG